MIDRDTPGSSDAGISLVEVVIAMFLLMLVMMSFLPLAVQSIVSSARFSTQATANQVLSDEIDRARAIVNCADLGRYAAAAPPVTTDGRGVELTATRSLSGTCPASGHSGTMSYSVTVSRADEPTGSVATAATVIYVVTP